MGKDAIRYLIFLQGRWRWRPTATMRKAGFRLTTLSPGTLVNGRRVPSADDVARAVQLNAEWDGYRQGPRGEARRRYPRGSVGDGYERAIELRKAQRAAKGIIWTNEQRSRDDWARAWRWIEPVFGDVDPKTVTPELLLDLRTLALTRVSESEAHRMIKVWRALWKKMAVLGLCALDRDPSLLFVNSAPAPRQALWTEGEAVWLVKRAWREGYRGLAALLATAWDSQLSPVDVRHLRAQDMRSDHLGVWFDVARAKTGRKALATVSRRAHKMLAAYLKTFAAEPVGRAPIFRNRSGAPYSKDTLGDDFRAVRIMVFGQNEGRQLAYFRRSGSVEALAGKADPAQLSAKMANSIASSNKLHRTYVPTMLASVRGADAARKVGRSLLREQKPDESVTGAGQRVSRTRSPKS